MLSTFYVAADVALGRVDYETLSDQTLMELFIDNMTDAEKEIYKDENGAYLDITEWESVTIDQSSNAVVALNFDFDEEGSLAFAFMPRTVYKFSHIGGMITGTIDTSVLPNGLEEFTLTHAVEMSGTINFCTLPSSLIDFEISSNDFRGSADLSALPKGLVTLDISYNNFIGSVILDKLPPSLEELSISANNFDGSLCFDALPEPLWYIDASKCNFSGSINLSSLPMGIDTLYVHMNALTGDLYLPNRLQFLADAKFSYNAFTGVAVVHSKLCGAVTFHNNKITAVVDETGADYVCEKDADGFVRGINVYANRFM